MGTDIHVYIEQKTIKNDNPLMTHWISVDEWINHPCFEAMEVRKKYWTDRNYLLFAILANVRNRYSIQPISLPKGLPDDVSPEVKNESDEENGDAHTRSWLSLKELLEYDWQQTMEDDDEVICTFEDLVIPFVSDFIPRLSKIDEPENVRMVFWFDN
ncbi:MULTISPECIES: hypothetical protein [Bacillales]|uniref:hypothetical protein n=1 Tax=Bacillales TaxID=1385 RepID=UPI000807E329|nr:MULTISPECIES: hypothetical protein [Bacillales]OBZ16384.1 hypothetical protein A7975_00120 [Bacillus sp. FJAT-26390]